MDWFTVEKIDEVTFAISEYGHWEQVRSFLLLGTKKALLIDAGLGVSDLKTMVRELTTLPITVVLTHVHWDHIGSLAQFETICVHEKDRQWLETGIDYWTNAMVVKELVRDLTQPLPVAFAPEDYQMYRGKPSQSLVDQHVIDLGGRTIRVLHTPGHSPGHICLVELETGYLCTGDLLYSKETPIYANYPSTSPGDLVNSLLKVANVPNVTKLLPSHNSLELPLATLATVKEACDYLVSQSLVKHGTGLHSFEQFSILF